MKKNKLKPIFLILTGLLWTSFTQAQNSVNTAGGDATGSGGTVSYSYGQAVYNNYANDSGIFIEGVQQPPHIVRVLPLTLMSFSVKLDNNKDVILNWSTVSERDVDYFIIERSDDGVTFSPLAKKAAIGNTTQKNDYTLKDKNPLNGYNYYRLKIIDLDGKNSYSLIDKVFINSINSMTMYPNPTQDVVYVKWNDLSTGLSYDLFDIKGSKLVKGKVTQEITAISLNNLPQGNYTLVIKNKSGEKLQTFKIIKIN